MVANRVENFTIGESTITMVEAGIYEARRGHLESSVCSLNFDNGEEIKIHPRFSVEIDSFNVVGEDKEGEIKLRVSGNGTFEFCDNGSQILFEGKFRAEEKDTHIAIRNHIVVDLKVSAAFNGMGKHKFNGQKITGSMEVKHAGIDASGLGIFKLCGTGKID
jgi:hypothetical protein